jgi:hypothetical protein
MHFEPVALIARGRAAPLLTRPLLLLPLRIADAGQTDEADMQRKIGKACDKKRKEMEEA